MEKKLFRWYYNQIIEGKKVTTREFKSKAREYSEDSAFKASNGWLEKFRKRYKIKLN